MTPVCSLRSRGTFLSVFRRSRMNNARVHTRVYFQWFQPRGASGLWQAPVSKGILTRPVSALVKVSYRDPQTAGLLKKRISGACSSER